MTHDGRARSRGTPETDGSKEREKKDRVASGWGSVPVKGAVRCCARPNFQPGGCNGVKGVERAAPTRTKEEREDAARLQELQALLRVAHLVRARDTSTVHTHTPRVLPGKPKLTDVRGRSAQGHR
eukprot:2542518-Prymnesium_polylepis.1